MMTFHHVGIAVASIATAAVSYEQALGLKLEGPIVQDETQRVRVAFVPTGPASYIEFVEPMDDTSPVSRIVKRGGGPYHVCYVVRELEDAIEQVIRSGGRLVSGPVPAKAFHNREIAFVYTPDRSLVELLADTQLTGIRLE
jgi:methylmalonyl-CoA/ethylmalonyl-CoA epimerase